MIKQCIRLFRYGTSGNERPGVLLTDGVHPQGLWLDVYDFGAKDFDRKFFESGLIDELREWVLLRHESLPRVLTNVRLGPPVADPSKIVCVGLNYLDHAEETGAKKPAEPLVFMKSTTSLNGINDPVVIPRNSKKCDWEIELALVIGKRASYVAEADAFSYVAGYTIMVDYSEREFQKERGGQFTKGKSCDTFGPLGPWIVTRHEWSGVPDLKLSLAVNGVEKQSSRTSAMLFNVPFLVSYISQFMTLLPGDIVSTGTPGGVGMARTPPEFLKSGDVVQFSIEGLGEGRQIVRDFET